MNKYAIVKDGVVVNTIEYAEQPTTPPPGFEAGHVAIQADAVSPGWVYTNGEFTNPNPPIVVAMPAPKSLTDMILADPTELAKLKQALGIS
ncbi:hypothetical protein UFOVP996_21 [uncultured Caudovirales phage]|uniref:Uncharacterized protein n=1 Tax=uncultured Caudovirales phage TaxID=2100421 RepID=A0A6J5Q302_9CAUD|nr:hypothetical protein UFOVP996_21 [uncultured Caudovirales phage]